MKTFIIEHDKKFEYQINKLTSWNWVNLLTEITQCVTSTEQFTAKNIVAALHTIGQTGVGSSAKPTEIKKVLEYTQSNTFSFFYDVIRNALNNASEERRRKIFDLALTAVKLNNGNTAAGGMLMDIDLDSVDNYIQDPMDLLLLVKESIAYNYMPIFKRFFPTAPSSN